MKKKGVKCIFFPQLVKSMHISQLTSNVQNCPKKAEYFSKSDYIVTPYITVFFIIFSDSNKMYRLLKECPNFKTRA